MPSTIWTQLVGVQQAQATLFNSYTTAKTVISTEALFTFPANFFKNVGQTLRVHATGGESHRATGPDTMTFQVMFGSVIIFTTGAVNCTTTVHTTIPWTLDVTLTLNATGSGTAAKFFGQGVLSGQGFNYSASAADNAAGGGIVSVPNTAPAVGTGFDSTSAQVLDFWVAQSFSGAGNGIQVAQYEAWSDN